MSGTLRDGFVGQAVGWALPTKPHQRSIHDRYFEMLATMNGSRSGYAAPRFELVNDGWTRVSRGGQCPPYSLTLRDRRRRSGVRHSLTYECDWTSRRWHPETGSVETALVLTWVVPTVPDGEGSRSVEN